MPGPNTSHLKIMFLKFNVVLIKNRECNMVMTTLTLAFCGIQVYPIKFAFCYGCCIRVVLTALLECLDLL